jgi:hypothetical protein
LTAFIGSGRADGYCGKKSIQKKKEHHGNSKKLILKTS